MSESAMVGAAAVGATVGIAVSIGIAWYVLLVIAWWKVFTKAGEDGWKCLIPFYNVYIMYKISWNTNMFWVWLICTLGYAIFSVMGDDKSVDVFYVLTLVFSVAELVVSIIQLHRLSVAFGHGVGYTIGLIFLNPFFMLGLGFGSSQYVGKKEIA